MCWSAVTTRLKPKTPFGRMAIPGRNRRFRSGHKQGFGVLLGDHQEFERGLPRAPRALQRREKHKRHSGERRSQGGIVVSGQAISRALGFFLAITGSLRAACRGRRVPCSQLRTAWVLMFRKVAKSAYWFVQVPDFFDHSVICEHCWHTRTQTSFLRVTVVPPLTALSGRVVRFS